MPQKIAIVGAGLIGAALAYQLARRGDAVTLIDAGLPGHAASGRSFGWLNASFFANEDHFHLRQSGLAAWRRLKSDVPDLSLRWPGALWWEEQGEALHAMHRKLGALDYPVAHVSGDEVAKRLPDLATVPDEALFFPSEGTAETGEVVHQLLRAAQSRGAQVIAGVRATGLKEANGRVAGVLTNCGMVAADQVVICAGTGAADLLSPLGIKLPMLSRPGVMLQSRPLPQFMDQIVVTPQLEIRQDGLGRLLFPTSPGHQGDTAEAVPDLIPLIADAESRLQALFPDLRPEWEQAFVSARPVPGDGMPAVGAIGPKGQTLAVMHSGATLAAIIAEIVAEEMHDDLRAPMLKPYRPERFQ
jgi:glycine/D-amino acid oxidase-like deaminating enzyme